jgi:hypothetical protein
MKARISLLAALVIAGAACLAGGEAGAQPFGRGYGRGASEAAHERNDARREVRQDRREERGPGDRGRGGRGQGDREERGGYRGGQAYGPEPRGYAYPPPAYPYPQSAPPSAYAPPPAYAQPRAYGYAPAPNSLGSGWRPQQGEARRGVRSGAMRPLGDVVANIQRTTRGRMLDAGVEPGPDGRPTYRVRWAAQGGRRIDFIVDAATGAIIGQSGY